MKSNLKIGLITASDPNDKRSWSGINARMLDALRNEFETVVVLGPLTTKWLGVLRIFSFFVKKITGKNYNVHHSILRSLVYSFKLSRKLKKHKIDTLVSLSGSVEIAFLKTKIPICCVSDSSFGQLNNYYDSYSNLVGFSVAESNFIERRALDNSSSLVYSSDWAASYVVKNYEQNKDKVSVVSFGANIDNIPSQPIVEKKIRNKVFRLLFLAAFWERKGGDIALETVKILNTKGYNVLLTVCGCIPPEKNENVEVIPFLNKNIKEDVEKLYSLFEDSNLLFLPTRADCTPIVFCEANAFGLPVLTADTGGIKSVIKNGENGIVLPFDATPLMYANKVIELIDNELLYNSMCKKSRSIFEKELNWKVWGQQMREILLKTNELIM